MLHVCGIGFWRSTPRWPIATRDDAETCGGLRCCAASCRRPRVSAPTGAAYGTSHGRRLSVTFRAVVAPAGEAARDALESEALVEWHPVWWPARSSKPLLGGDPVQGGFDSHAAPPSTRGGVPMRYRVLIQQDEDGVFVAEVPALPGCISQGPTRSEAMENIREAVLVYLESLEAHGEPIPPSIDEEVIEVVV